MALFQSLQVSVKLHKCDGKNGTFSTPFTQTVSTEIPTKDGKEPCYVTSDVVGEYWPCMLEKAVAAAHYRTDSGQNGYEAQAGGITGIGMGQLVGGFPGVACKAHLSAADLYKAWDYLMAQGVTITCGWKQVPSLGASPPLFPLSIPRIRICFPLLIPSPLAFLPGGALACEG